MIHRALFGRFERFIGILIEHYAGEFPLWLAPVQAIVLPDRRPSRRVRGRGRRDSCAAAGVRVEVDDRTESIGRKIREAELRKIPYMLVVGRPRGRGRARSRCGSTARATRARLALDAFAERLAAESADRSCVTFAARLGPVDAQFPARAPVRLTRRRHHLVPVPRRFDRRPARAGHDTDQRTDPRSRGPPHRRGRQPGRRS